MRSQVDESSRNNDFPELYKLLIQRDATVDNEYKSNESFGRNCFGKGFNNQCLKVVTKSVFQSTSTVGTTKVASFGGRGAQGKCFEV